MTKSRNRPRIAGILLRFSLPKRARQSVVADLDEEYMEDILPTRDARKSRLWYWREALSLMQWYLFFRLRRGSLRYFRRPSISSHKDERPKMTRICGFLDSVFQDVRYGIRSMRRRPVSYTHLRAHET